MARKRIGTFKATGDDGLEYTVIMYGSTKSAANMVDPGATFDPPSDMQTSQGATVTRKTKGEYLILATGMTLRSTDPNAP